MVRPLVRPMGQPAEPPIPEPSADPSPASAAPVFDTPLDAPLDDGPARRLQQELERALVGAPAEPRWSGRRSLALIVATNALLWLALIWGLRAIF